MIGQDYPHLDLECVGKSWSRTEIIKPLQPSNVIKRRELCRQASETCAEDVFLIW